MAAPRTTPPDADDGTQLGAEAQAGLGSRVRRTVREILPPRGGIEAAVRRVFAPHLEADRGRPFLLQWRSTLRLLWPLGAVSRGNDVRLFSEGDDVFEAMWTAIEGAEKRVLFTTYTLADDRVGRRFRDALAGAAWRGVEVSVIVDSFGSSELGARFVRPLVEAGAQFHWFNPMLRWRTRFSRLVRNHRKILVVDEDVAFCGGMNSSEDYAGERHGNGLFRDAHLALRGPCARDLAELHRETLRSLRVPTPRPFGAAPPVEDGFLVQVLESNVRRQQRTIQRALHFTLVRAVERCYLTSPYFVPPARLLRDLADAAQRGVDVRVLTAGVSDVPLVTMASNHLYGRLLRAGVRVFEMHARTLHAKTVTVDGVYASVGSFNLDHLSYRRNLEVTVTVLAEDAARAVEARFHQDLELSHEVTLEAWRQRSRWRRLRDWAAYRLASV